MDDLIILALGRQLIDLLVQREQLIRENRDLSQQLKAKKEPETN